MAKLKFNDDPTPIEQIMIDNGIDSLVKMSKMMGIPLRSIQQWKSRERSAPGYLIDLIRADFDNKKKISELEDMITKLTEESSAKDERIKELQKNVSELALKTLELESKLGTE